MNRIDEMKEMIRREIRNIPNMKERVMFKALMEEVFLAVYETNVQMYQELEKRVQDELTYDVNRYLIKTGVIERESFDCSHHLMYPMEETDLEFRRFDMLDIKKGLKEKGEFSLMKVLVRCDFQQLQEIWNNQTEFDGIIETTQPECSWKVSVCLRQNKEYLKRIGQLYNLFIKNGIPWQTVNAPYLYKMADVILTQMPEGSSGTEKICKVTINFREYNQFICYGLIPVWNIQHLILDSVGFPVPCMDHKNYEHSLSIKEYGTQHVYLAEDDRDIQSICQKEERLLITSGAVEAKKWDIYMIRNGEDSKIDSYTYPIMHNERAKTFTEKFQKKWKQDVKTRAELERFIKGFCLEAYVVYKRCEIADRFKQDRETYSMNPFIEDEIRDSIAQKKIILYFSAGEKEPWIQRDIISFLVSEVQRLYPEYECGGILE